MSEKTEIKINERLKLLRDNNNYTQQKLADYLHVDRSTYAYYELDKTKPSLMTACKLAEFYQITIDELVYGCA